MIDSSNRILRGSWILLAAMPLVASAAAARSQDDDAPPPDPAAEEPSDAQADPDATPPATLDELLGLESDRDAADAAERQRQEELQRRLEDEALGDAFAQAIAKMALSADLLDVQFDTGLGTQRIQEEIIDRLADLIEQARRRSNSGGSASASARTGRSAQPNPGRENRAQGDPNRGQQRTSDPADCVEGGSPPRQDGDLNTVIDETRAEWGSLPQRVRDMMHQGSHDQPSSLYDRLTAEYYKRLAEDNAP